MPTLTSTWGGNRPERIGAGDSTMKVDGALRGYEIGELAGVAAAMERLGHNGVWMPEINHDPFLPLPAVAAATSRITVGTGIAIAFARSPMLLAYLGSDLQLATQGRFILGLGSQVRAHVTRRFSMPWSHPAARMRELISAVRAIWRSFETGDPLDFRGDFYSHTLMTPEFSPAPARFGLPPIFLAAVGERMTEVAGEVADGLFLHSFTTERYVREISLPTLERSLRNAGRERSEIDVVGLPFIATGMTEEQLIEAREATRRRIAFYGSTPAYRPVLELHGWGDLGDELHRLSVSSDPARWDRLVDLIDDEVLGTFAIVAEPAEVATAVADRFGGCFDRLRLNRPPLPEEPLSELVSALQVL